ncbi:MAG: hypothetical protein ABIY55_07880 [Kofleriaceae bacterium]
MLRPDLQPLEAAVLDRLLAGDHPVLVRLRGQLSRATVTRRERTGVGFFVDFALPPAEEPASVGTLRIGDVAATVTGLQHGAGFVLFVNDGLIKMFEGFSYDEPWPDEITKFSVRYQDPARAAIAVQLG